MFTYFMPNRSLTLVINVQTFAASGTYTPHAGLSYADFDGVGGGGAGGGCDISGSGARGGGGGGGAARELARLTSSTIGASKAVVIGAKGTGVVSNTGNPGTDTTVGSTLFVAKHGTGGNACFVTNVPGGGGTGGGTGTGDSFTAGVNGSSGSGTSGGAGGNSGDGSANGKGGQGGSGSFGSKGLDGTAGHLVITETCFV